MARKEFKSRKWLNEKRGRAFTIVSVNEDLENKNDYSRWVPSIDAYMDIGDCSDTICLDFCVNDLSDKKECEKIKRKMARFRKEFKKLEKRVLKCIDSVDNVEKDE